MSKGNVRARVVKVQAPSSQTKQIYVDEFSGMYGDIISPPYNLKELKKVSEHSTILQQCMEAYKTNIVGFGFQPEYTFDYNGEDVQEDIRQQADSEWVRLEEFVQYLNFDDSAEAVLGHAIEDREATGNGFVEIIRDGRGLPAGIEYADAQFIRVCQKTVPEQVTVVVLEGGKPTPTTRWRRFRKYAQQINGQTVYFKEYGDPRILNLKTGKFDDSTPEHLQATEFIHLKVGSGTYGVPRWIGHLVHLYGARKAEELNFLYFKQGRHTPAAVTVENGLLSEDSYDALQEYMNDIEGVENAHKFLVIEAEGHATESTSTDGREDEKITPVKVQIKSLADMLQQDALFLEYDEKSRNKLRSAFRLPPLYTGESQDYNKATSDTARKITEEQVFQPQREGLARRLNTLFMPDLELSKVRLKLDGPDFHDPLEIATVLAPYITAGAVSPNDLRDSAGEVLGKTLEEWPEEIYNRPLSQAQASQQPNPLEGILKADKNGESELVSLLKDMRDVLEGLTNGKSE